MTCRIIVFKKAHRFDVALTKTAPLQDATYTQRVGRLRDWKLSNGKADSCKNKDDINVGFLS